MTKRRKRILLAVLLLTLSLTLVWLSRREPRYQGRTLGQWFAASRLERAARPSEDEYRDALRALGTNDFPRLVRHISFDANRCLPQKVFNILPGSITPQRLLEYLLDKKWNADAQATDAMEVFQVLGPQGAPAIPGLTRIALNGPLTPAIRAVDCLGHIGPAAIPALIVVATNSQPQNFRAMGWLVAFTNSETAMRFASQYAANPDFQAVFGRLPISAITNRPAQ